MSHNTNTAKNGSKNEKNNTKNGSSKNAANTNTANAPVRMDERMRSAYDTLLCVSAWVLQAQGADAAKAATADIEGAKNTLADADTRKCIRIQALADGHEWARIWGAWKAAQTMNSKTSAANKGAALAHANALAVGADEAHKRLCAYINYNYKKGVWDAPVSPSKVKEAAKSVNIIYNNKGLNLDAMLRAAIKAAAAK